MKWSTSAAEQIVRKVLVPLGALAVFLWEARLAEPQGLIIAAAVTLMIGQPVAALLDRKDKADREAE